MASWGAHKHTWVRLYSSGGYDHFECACGAVKTAPRKGK